MRITLWIPVTPARVSETCTRGAEACTSCRSATSSLAGRLTLRIVRALPSAHLQAPLSPPPAGARLDLRARRRPRASGRQGPREGGLSLPDDEVFADGEIAFAPGALEGIFGGPDDSEFGREAVERIYDALVALAADPGTATRRRLAKRFREGYVRARIDPLRDRLVESPPKNAELLYPELREIFLRSGHRDEVKFAMALMSGFRRPGDADLFRVIGRHAEFTLYAAVALATVTDDPLAEWLALLEHVEGWGRTELHAPDPARAALARRAGAARPQRPRHRQRARARGRLRSGRDSRLAGGRRATC